MASVQCYLNELDNQRDKLANILNDKGIEASEDETYNSLVEKVSQIETGGGNIPVTAKVLATLARESILGNATSFNLWNYWQGTEGNQTTSAVTATPTDRCLLLAAVMHRGNVEIVGDGWTKLISVSAIYENENIDQRITVWTKAVEKGSYVVTVNQASSVRLNLKVIALYKADSVSVVENTAIASFPFTPTATTGKRRLYLLSSIFTSGTTAAITVSSSGTLDLQKAERTRFSVFYDYQPEENVTPVFGTSVSYNANTSNAITLDIEEV